MEPLEKKLNKIKNMFSDIKASIQMPAMPKPPAASKTSGVAPKTQKDPTKVAEQIKDPDTKDQVMDSAKKIKESMTTSKLGQWSIKNK